MEDKNSSTLAKLLKYYRKKKGLSQMAVASHINVSRSCYANYEEGLRLPSADKIFMLSDLLEHDFIFAFSEACRERALPFTLEEEQKYNSKELNAENIGSFIYEFRKLTRHDQRLIFRYVKIKIQEMER